MTLFDKLKGFWNRQSRNYKMTIVRDSLDRLFGGGGGGGVGGPLAGGPYWSLLMERLGFEAVEIGLISSLSSAVNVLFAIPSGLLTDRTKNIKQLYLVGRVFSLPLGLMRYLASNWPFCVLIGLWQTLCWRIMGPASQIITVDALSDKDRVTGLSINRMMMGFAGVIGPMLSALIINYFGGLKSADNIRPLFLIQLVISIIVLIFLVTQMSEVTFTREKQKTSVLSQLFSVYKEVPVLKLLLLRQCVMRFIMDIGMPFQSIYLVDIKGANEFILGWRSTVQTALVVCLSLPTGRLANSIGRRKVAYFGRVFGWIGLLLMIMTPSTHPEYLIVASFLEGFRMLMFIGWMAFTQELIPIEARGRYTGLSMTINGLVGVIAPILGGLIWNLNPDYLYWIRLLGDALIILPLMMIIGHKSSKNKLSYRSIGSRELVGTRALGQISG